MYQIQLHRTNHKHLFYVLTIFFLLERIPFLPAMENRYKETNLFYGALYICLPDRCRQKIHKSKKRQTFSFCPILHSLSPLLLCIFCPHRSGRQMYKCTIRVKPREKERGISMETRYKETNLLWPYFTKHEMKFCQVLS